MKKDIETCQKEKEEIIRKYQKLLGNCNDLVKDCNNEDNKIVDEVRNKCRNLKYELELLKFIKLYWDIDKDDKVLELIRKCKLRKKKGS